MEESDDNVSLPAQKLIIVLRENVSISGTWISPSISSLDQLSESDNFHGNIEYHHVTHVYCVWLHFKPACDHGGNRRPQSNFEAENDRTLEIRFQCVYARNVPCTIGASF